MLPRAPIQFHRKILAFFRANGLDPEKTASESLREKFALISCLADLVWQHAQTAKTHPEDIAAQLNAYAALVMNKGDIRGLQASDYRCSMHDLLRLQPIAQANLLPDRQNTNQILGVYLNASHQWIQSSLQYAFARVTRPNTGHSAA